MISTVTTLIYVNYPGEAADAATADLRRRLAGTKVDDWGVYVVTVTGRAQTVVKVIDPDGLLRHAEQIAETGRGRPMDAALQRGISTAYYSIFHDLTRHTASHLLGSCPQEIQNEIRRSWSHGESRSYPNTCWSAPRHWCGRRPRPSSAERQESTWRR